MKTTLVTGIAAGCVVASGALWPVAAADTEPAPSDRSAAPAPADSYIVTTKPSVGLDDVIADAAPSADVTAVTGPAFRGGVADLTDAQAAALAETPGVVAVEPEQLFTAAAETRNQRTRAQRTRAASVAATWALDRIDQRELPLNGRFSPTGTGKGVHVYVVDSGITPKHPEFAGRIGKGTYTNGGSLKDCYGHGTHVAGTIASNTYGIAPDAIVHPVRVLDCAGGGSTSSILAGLNWVARNAPRDAIVNLSLRGSYSAALNSAVRDLVRSGRIVVTASGNDGTDACKYSPGSESAALNIGATDTRDREASFSNFGECVDMYAPGVAIRSTDFAGGTSRLESGTSMAAPHVSAVAAVLWQSNPKLSGEQIQAKLLQQATRGAVAFPLGQSESPNLLLFAEPARSPGTPGRVTAAAGDAKAKVKWRRASSNTATTSYTVTAAPGGLRCRTTNDTTCTVKGLANGVSYTFTVRANNIAGRSQLSSESPAVQPTDVTAARQRAAKGPRATRKGRTP